MLFSAYMDNFLDHHRFAVGNSAGEMSQKTMCLKVHLVPFFGDKDFNDISQQHLSEYITQKRKSGLSPVTINHHLTILARYLSHARENKLLDEGPKVRRLKVAKTRHEKNYLTPDEAKKLYAAAEKHRRPGWRLMIIIAANTGMRIGEMLALDWSNVNFDTNRISIEASFCRLSKRLKSTKSGNPRMMMLTESAAQAFRQLHRLEGEPKNGLVMHSNYDTAQRAMQSISKRANLGKTVTWHTLRHTFASNLVCSGKPLWIVSKLLGHTSVSMSERYSHLLPSSELDAVRCLDGVL